MKHVTQTETKSEEVEIFEVQASEGNFAQNGSLERPSLVLCLVGNLLMLLLIATRVYCGLYMIISDCDETYNYWEPLNRISRGFGKQTWEYLPAWAIRSYAYLIPYYLALAPLRDFAHLTGLVIPPYVTFYFIRVVALAGFCAFCELSLYRSIKRNLAQSTANWYLFFSALAPGMAHASAALLPSSFAMSWVTWGTASALEVLSEANTLAVVGPSVHAIFCFLVAGLFGWPFALAIGVPFGLFTLRARYQTPPLTRIVFSCWALLPALVLVLLLVDSYFYTRPMLFVPFNIVLYNVFSRQGEGPDIFGVEPFSYYILNLALNFNVVFVLGYAGAVLNPYICSHKYRAAFGSSVPILVWSFILFRQPHKEERFLYPIYTLICLSAAVFFSETLKLVRRWTPRLIYRILVLLSVALYSSVSVSRILALVHTYSAPLTTATVFHDIAVKSPSSTIQNVCVGREWYHFPTSFFLPDNYRLRFVRSGFDGLLPGDFAENVTLREAASVYPVGMNPKNQFDAGKVIPFDHCDFYIDNTAQTNAASGEPQIVDVRGTINPAWEQVACGSIADPSQQGFNVRRMLYVPQFMDRWTPAKEYLMDYCVFKKRPC